MSGYGMNAKMPNTVPMMPIAKLLSRGSTHRKLTRVFPVLAVDATKLPMLSVMMYGQKLEQSPPGHRSLVSTVSGTQAQWSNVI